MKFSTRQDVDVPVAELFAAATDFPRFEQRARRRGAALKRVQNPDGPGLGWHAEFTYRGKRRKVDATLPELVEPEKIVLDAVSGGLSALLTVDFVAISPTKSRMVVGLDLRPSSLPARLLIQSLKLGKSALDRKFAERVRNFAKFVQENRRNA